MKKRIHRTTSKRHLMSQQPQLTDELLNSIVNSKRVDALLSSESSSEKDLGSYLTAKLEEKGLKKSEVIKAAQLNETFGYQIFSGSRKPSRNYIIALGFAMGLDVHDLRLALCHGDAGDLYAKNRRDAIILFCASHGYSLMRADEELYRYGEDTITDGGEQVAC